MGELTSLLRLILGFMIIQKMSESAESHRIQIVILVLGEDPSYGYYATLPMFDLAFQRASLKYPELYSNITRHVLYQRNVKDCAAAGADMLDVAGKLFDLIDRHDGLTVLLAPGCSLEVMALADFARGDSIDHSLVTSCGSIYIN